VALNASAIATLPISTLTVGTHSITANYAGDGTFNSSVSTTMSLVIPNPDFNLAAAAFSPSSIAPGASATSAVAVNPIAGMNPSAVVLTCAVSPVASPAAKCSIGAIAVTNNVGTATLTITTTGPQAAVSFPARDSAPGRWLAFSLALPAMLLGGAGMSRTTRRKLLGYCLFFVLLSACVMQGACGGSTKTTTTTVTGNTGTPAGIYNVTITGVGNGITHSASISVTVQ
jgi:hypothetical protein